MLEGGYVPLALGLRGGDDRRRLRSASTWGPSRRGGRGCCDEVGTMTALAWVAVGALGGAMAIARFLLDGAVAARLGGDFPAGTLAVNLSGAVVLGVLAGAALSGSAYTIVAGGGVGTYTTFSTWMLESTAPARAATRGCSGRTSRCRWSRGSPPWRSATGSGDCCERRRRAARCCSCGSTSASAIGTGTGRSRPR